ncbi:MAG: chemotaxis protein CheB [Chloroflexia bacterium]
MSHPNPGIIVIGGSAGSIEVLGRVLADLPSDLQAPVFVVVHLSPTGNSKLPEVLGRHSSLPVAFARHGERIRPGRVYLAPPDMHLIVREDCVELSHGPRENHTRPAIDPTFRTAAFAHGEQVIGVVLSGGLDDGSVGATIIKASGGITVVQDPEEALYDSMPRSALRYMEGADHIVQAAKMGSLLGRLAREASARNGAEETGGTIDQGEQQMEELYANQEQSESPVIQRDMESQAENRRANSITIFTCPDCGGTLWQLELGNLVRFQCHVGHAWSPEVVLAQKSEQVEATLWAAARLLTEKAIMTRQFARQVQQNGDSEGAQRITEQADLDDEHLRILKEQLLEATPNPSSQAAIISEVLDRQYQKDMPSG